LASNSSIPMCNGTTRLNFASRAVSNPHECSSAKKIAQLEATAVVSLPMYIEVQKTRLRLCTLVEYNNYKHEVGDYTAG
jgi:hypothetical protein